MPATILLTAVAMIAFAANSLLARAALGADAIDAAGYTAVRLASGALALASLLMLSRGTRATRNSLPGTWSSALALFVYAIAFSLAYLRLGAAAGALILFASVQGTMILWGIVRRDRPNVPELCGLTTAFAAFVYLLLPGLGAPDPIGSILMIVSGIAWGIYSLRGRGARNPLDETAGNFIRSVPMCLPLLLLPTFAEPLTAAGIGLAVVSGVVASGLGYAIWYRSLPGLSTTQAAVVQLTVPVIAAFGAVLFLAETPTLRLALCSACILGGVALAILARRPAGRH
jgi:drug/metabolite transporter (DMT)-like permease